MKQINFKVDLKIKDLYAFTMRHTYHSASGIFGVIISIASLISCVAMFSKLTVSTRIALIFVGLLFTVIQPAVLYLKCKRQIKMNRSINAPLEYVLSDDGICVCQKDESVEVKWHEIRKVIVGKCGLYLYMSPVRAFIFPEDQCGREYEAIKAMVKRQMEKYKDYVPEEDEMMDGSFEEDEDDEE